MNHTLEIDLPTDPDAQATVTDFLDFTEYLPSDIIRSLTLIGNLDQSYLDYSGKVNSLTKKYGDLPNLPVEEKQDPVMLRAEVSENLSYAVSARTLSHAEAIRMANNVDRHYHRINNILTKLQKMQENYPATRENSPEAKVKSPVINKASKLVLRLDGARSGVRQHRAPRITVPGEVLAPYELDYESYGSESEDDFSDLNTPRYTPALSTGAEKKKIKLTIPKLKKEKNPKPPRGPRPPGVMGTNVHSAVAGISTSNALAKLKPPPPDSVKGDINLPWLQLNPWELALLRKRMKKNAIWSPSDTMIARELKQLGRGIEAYRAAKAKSEAAGVEFSTIEPPQLRGETVHAEGAISVEALRTSDPQLSNRGMKLNEAKKLKKENQAKELAKQAAEEAEESARNLANTLVIMGGLFAKPAGDDKKSSKTPSKTPAKKRKRESSAAEVEKVDTEKRPPLKRNKTETPVPVPITTKSSTILPSRSTPSSSSHTPTATPLEAPANGMTVAPLVSPKKSSTPILPPVKEKKGTAKKESTKKVISETAANSRPRRTSGAPTPTPAPEPLPAKRPTSSRSNAEATATIDRPRRASTARNTPAPEPRTNKRTKRPAPGQVTTSSDGSTTVASGKRKKATKKSAGQKKRKVDENGRQGSEVQDFFEEIDDEGNIIPADEPRYCVCNRVSFGTMIECENPDVSFPFLCDKMREADRSSARKNGFILSASTSLRFRLGLRNGTVLSAELHWELARRVLLVRGERGSDS